MSKLKLTIAVSHYDHVIDLLIGQVRVEGAELTYLDLPLHDIFLRAIDFGDFDISEMSLAKYVSMRSQGDDRLIALPVFPARVARHSSIYVRRGGPIKTPADLAGRRVGVPNMQPAANVWIKGILRDEFGLQHRDFVHVVEEDEEIDFVLPPEIRVERAPAGRTVFEMLESGELPAVISPLVPRSIVEGGGQVRRLFPDYVDRERDYYMRTGLFPIMHLTAIRTELLDQHPWLAATLTHAFENAKRAAYRRVANTRLVPLAWFGAHWEAEQALFGGDAWPNGLCSINRRNLQTAIAYSFDQGLTRTELPLEALFAPTDEPVDPASTSEPRSRGQ